MNPRARVTGLAPAENKWVARLRGFGPVGILVTVLIPVAGTPLISALFVIVWVRLSRTPWVEIGFAPPRSWTRDVLGGIVFGVTLKLVMKAIVMPLLGAAPLNQTYQYLSGNAREAAFMAVFVTVSGGFAEETVYRGFLFNRLTRLFGSRLALLLSSLWFAAVHYLDQGITGVEQAFLTGLTFGAMFLVTRSLVLGMVTHAAFDLTAVALIYWNLEARIAHLVFN